MRTKCIFCDKQGIRQPALPTRLLEAESPDGVTYPVCEYHNKLFNAWAEGEEWLAMRDVYKKYWRIHHEPGTRMDGNS